MTDIIQRLLQDVFGTSVSAYRSIFLGLGGSGRTTALYQLKLGEVACTIPTIGFNVETIRFKGADFTVWDVGGDDKLRPLWRHYFAGTDFWVFFVDCHDSDQLDAARSELYRLLSEDDLLGVPFCVLANKQDLENAMSAEELTEYLGLPKFRASAQWAVLPASSITGQGLADMMEWALEAVSSKPKGKVERIKSAEKEKEEPKEADSQEQVMAKKVQDTFVEWLTVQDGSDDEFLQQLDDCTLDNWDHRTHLRIAWLLLSRHGRRDGLPKIFAGIRHFIENSKRTYRSKGTTFHETMTYFWTHMVHYAMVTTANPRKDFKTFLLLNPQLANGGLFLHYYSKKLMLQTADSRMQVVLPDIRPLPSLVTDVEKLAKEVPKDKIVPRAAPLSDEEFRVQWQEGTLVSWGHEYRLRAIWLCLKRHGRREGVKRAFEGLEATEKSGHHVTISYFWIQMTDYAVRKLEDNDIPTFGIFIQKRQHKCCAIRI